MTNYQKYLVYTKGWRDGAGCNTWNFVMEGVPSTPASRSVYDDGYSAGQSDRRRVCEDVATEFEVELRYAAVNSG